MATPNIPDWLPNTTYTIGQIFINAGTFYQVLTSYTSGATFGNLDLTNVTTQVNVETFMTFDEWRQLGNQAYKKCFAVETDSNNARGFAVAMAIALGS